MLCDKSLTCYCFTTCVAKHHDDQLRT